MKEKNPAIEIATLSLKEVLLYLVDAHNFAFQIFDSRKIYKKSLDVYWDWRNINHQKFSQSIYRLKRSKLIKVYQKEKEKYLELTPSGLDKVKKYILDDLAVESPAKWDKKWRIVIFDIPDDKKLARDILRDKLKRIGFILLQESVFIFPFECKREIDFITNNYFIQPYVKYILADIFEGDGDLIEKFLDLEVLIPQMINK